MSDERRVLGDDKVLNSSFTLSSKQRVIGKAIVEMLKSEFQKKEEENKEVPKTEQVINKEITVDCLHRF